MNLCKLLGHKPTWMTLEKGSQGFACWRCGTRLGWDGRSGFSVFYDKAGMMEHISPEAFREARSHRLRKIGHRYTVTTEDDKDNLSHGQCVLQPIDPRDLPDWVKKLEKDRR